MKYIYSLLLVICFLATNINAQNIAFSFQIDEINSTPENMIVEVYARSTAADETMVALTVVNYYNSLESTFLSSDFSELSDLGWNTSGNIIESSQVTGQNNGAVAIIHDSRYEVQVFDGGGAGTLFTAAPIKIGEIFYDNLNAGDANIGSDVFFGTTVTDPAIVYLDGNSNSQSIVVEGPVSVLLPVELTYFEASRYNDNSATLEWETASELDFSHFEIERSMDGRTWNNISKVQGQALNTLGAEYSYLDMNIPLPRATASTVYYRLKMVDNDGVYEYSDIRTVGFESQGVEVEVYPNPTANTITVNSEFPVTHVSVFDVDGKLVIDQDYLDAEIDLKQMNSGLYRVVITTEAGQFVKSIIKIE